MGGLVLDFVRDVEIYQEGNVLANGPTCIPQHNASRAVFEQVTRRRVAGLDGVTVRDQCHFEKNPNDAYCNMHARPKVQKVRETFQSKLEEA